MLIEFNAANVLSFKHKATLSMVASSDDSLNDSNTFSEGNLKLLRSAVIYGANASGKSNLLSAMHFMRHMVINSSKDTQADEEIDIDSFKLSSECEGKPSLFEAIFICSSGKYRYGFEVDRQKVLSEWLFHIPKTREAELFVREGNSFKVNNLRFKEGKDLEEKTRDNALFLSVCAQFNGKVSKDILTWFRNFRFIHGINESGPLGSTVDMLKEPEQKKRIMALISIADLGIDDLRGKKEKITLEKLPKDMPDELKKELIATGLMEVEMKTVHRKYGAKNEEVGDAIFDLDEDESAGTRKYLSMVGAILDTLDKGRILVIDELDARLHPLLTRSIVSLFHSPANRSKAQIIFASHDTGLLDKELFRRDQIWFTEKDRYGATSLYSMIELKGVRKEASFGKDYILGKFGGIPFIGDPSWLFCEAIQ
ncbi:ATP-binding protein [candidate division KSB1 bacterium]|nr:ATP-binding protein [candidate division KSB1 bacterium]